MDDELIEGYKLQRRNVYSNYIVCGASVLGGTILLSTAIGVHNYMPVKDILEMVGTESLIIGTATVLLPTIRSIPITLKIYQLKRGKRK